MPSLTGMKGDGYYDRHSSVQGSALDAVAGWIDQATDTLTTNDRRPVTIADYGCSEGRNSIIAVGRIVDALRARGIDAPIVAIHADLPSNNFNKLFANLNDPAASNYFQDRGRVRRHVHAFAVGGSFYGPLLPAGSVDFAISFLAVEWLDQLPDVPVPEFIGYMGGSPAAFQAFGEQAARDWTRFLQLRAEELVSGGKLLVVIPGSDGPRRCSDGMYDVLNDACVDLVDSGQMRRADYERLVVPVYFRSLDEMLAPLAGSDSPLADTYRMDRAEVVHVATAFVENYRRTGDVAAYAADYSAFLRAVSEPVVAASLAGSADSGALVSAIYERVRNRLAAEPERYMFQNIEVAVLLTRT
jgi:hypothetical protein